MAVEIYKFLLFLVSLCCTVGSASVHNITSTQFVRDPDVIVSSNSIFKLGFFSPLNSTDRYVGIWYNITSKPMEVLWVANRDNPLKDSSGVLKVSDDGNLHILDGQNNVLWSSNVTLESGSNSSVAQLLDNGNLVLLSNIGGQTIWQSFEHLTDSWLPEMQLGVYYNRSKTGQVVRSWKSPSDPSTGRFTLGMAAYRTPPEGFIWGEDGRPYWRTGPWNGNYFVGIPSTFYSGMYGMLTLQNNTLKFSPQDPTIQNHFELTYDGKLVQKNTDNDNHKMEVVWTSFESECDVYGKCGPFGICNPNNSPICSCLEGFEPINSTEWNNGNWSRGCTRKTPLQCNKMMGEEDGFQTVVNVKVPDHAEWLDLPDLSGEDECMRQCQAQCSCIAYSFYAVVGCMTWNQTLMDIQQFDTTAANLSIRLAHSELPGKNRNWKTIVAVVVVTGTITVACVAFIICCWIKQQRGKGAKRKSILPYSRMSELKVSDVELKDLPLFTLEKLVAATNNFHHSNKLGQGGFGPVYKGKLEDGQEIAVKRLSRASGQGLQEFMNEVLLISKLQHRNLVRLLGCCVEGDEQLLVYEYMPNKSLDAFLFEPSHQELLDWKTRFNIIQGICRGLLYLHRDSRLKIIHRDLKASNMLLDDDFNPKISDFGMARIFGGKEDQDNTSRVVGTYGYMSPEYAMEGRFSEKSDVFSFGVLLLEIISGRRNSSFKNDESLSLIGFAWKLWNEDDVLSLIDPIIYNPSFEEEEIKCIQVGLLCVQELPQDRPTISAVILMLENESSDLPLPMQPGFTIRRNCILHGVTADYGLPNCSVNDVSITSLSGR